MGLQNLWYTCYLKERVVLFKDAVSYYGYVVSAVDEWNKSYGVLLDWEWRSTIKLLGEKPDQVPFLHSNSHMECSENELGSPLYEAGD